MTLTFITICGITDGAFPYYQIGGILTFLPEWAAHITMLQIIAAVALYKYEYYVGNTLIVPSLMLIKTLPMLYKRQPCQNQMH